ncbi:MAG: outer membrane lipoprotein carrier protein LolA [Bacteroidota bacterium]
MRKLFFFFLFSIMITTAFAQKNTMSKAEDSDPQATAILKKVQQKYEAFTSVGMDFSLIIKVPEMGEEVQSGKMLQKGENYRLEMKDQLIFSNGETIWLYLKNPINEVQIMNVEEGMEGMLSPKDLLKIYEQKDFVYALTNRVKKNGKWVQQIEFKPLKEDVDYSKLRVSIENQTNEVVQIEAFGKDGTRYTLVVNELTPNVSIADASFQFNKADYPDVYVEDLRY